MGRIGKIEQHNLGPRILKMLTQDGLTSTQITEALAEEGFKLSQPTVWRWIKEQRESQRDHAKEILRDHVDKEIPKDLDALEAMEAHALKWANEEVKNRAERISTWTRVEEQVEEWAGQIAEAAASGGKHRHSIVKAFVAQCLVWLMEEHDNQAKRLAAMRMATAIIEVKLRHAGIIEGLTSGNIYIQEAERDPDEGDKAPDTEERRLFVIRREAEDA